MASGPLRFRTPHIEELPTTATRQAPGFAWVAVPSLPGVPDASKIKGKRGRVSQPGPTEAQREALSTRQQKEVERRIRELNSDGTKDVVVAIPKKDGTGGGGARAGKTANTKKILGSGKTFAHYLDDEEAEIARTGKRDGDLDIVDMSQLRRSGEGEAVASQGLTEADIQALLDAPPLTYNQARSAPPPPDAPPPRRFCRICGFFERARCRKCGAPYCSVVCKDAHDADQCLKFYA